MRAYRFVSRMATLMTLTVLEGCTTERVTQSVPESLQLAQFALESGLSPVGNTSLFVQVFDAESLKVINTATVRIAERAGKTDDLGRVFLDNLVSGETLVQVRAPGYVRVAMNTTLDRVHATLRVYLKKRSQPFARPANQQISIPPIEGITVTIPANALVDALGRAVAGEVNVYVTRLDLKNDFPKMAGSFLVRDETTREPQPLRVAGLVAIEVETKDGNGNAIPLLLRQGQSMTVEMPVDALTKGAVVIAGFGQDVITGRWQRSSVENSESLAPTDVAGKLIWKANVQRLGWLAPGLVMKDTQEITIRQESSGGVNVANRSVFVRAVAGRNVLTGFTNAQGETRLRVAKGESVKVEVPTLDDLGLTPIISADLSTFTYSAGPMNCDTAGKANGDGCTGNVAYCNGFEWGDAAPRRKLPYELWNGIDDDCNAQTAEENALDLGWRCDTGAHGVCALGTIAKTKTTHLDGTETWFTSCEANVHAGQYEEICNGLDDDCDGKIDADDSDFHNPQTVCQDPLTNQPGQTTCNEYGAIICAPMHIPSEIFDGKDNDGDGEIDEGFCKPGLTKQCVTEAGCTFGASTCDANGTWASCAGDATPETCNNLDDDCDGEMDEDCACLPGQTETCYTGPTDTAGIGACKSGVRTCDTNGQWSNCDGEVVPTTEIAGNMIDEDCNGGTETCTMNEMQNCYGGPAGTVDVGICHSGTQTCDMNGQWGACTGEVMPTNEIPSNGLNDDCDGLTDEVCEPGQTTICYTGAPGTADVGICKSGMQTCDIIGQWGNCANEVLPGPEFCNNLDDDCNGQTDDDSLCAHVCLTGCSGNPNGICDPGENSFNCAADCACGDGSCSGSETPESCHADCKFSDDLDGMCGNHHCDPWEVDYAIKTIFCPADCWDGITRSGIICGDGSCAPQEDSTKCAADCGNLTSYVNGNDVCEPGEHWSTSVDCPWNIDAGTFLKAECQPNSYALIETYADGNGGTTEHVVTNCSESCGAAPWKMLNATYNGTSFEGVQVLRPDCSTCTMTNMPSVDIVGDLGIHGIGWVDVYHQTTYEMDLNPNNCNLAVRPYNPGSPWYYYYILPVEWEKIGEKDCSQPGGCDVVDCAGAHYPQDFGFVGSWKPAYGSWSMYAGYCQ